MPDAVGEVKTQREIDVLTAPQRAAVLLSAVGPAAADGLYIHLGGAEAGRLLLEKALLPPVSDGVRRRLVREFRAELKAAGLIPDP